jgi:hypothetical protein
VLGDSYSHEGKTDNEIRKDVVKHKLGDAANGLTSDSAIEGAFAAITAGTNAKGVTKLADGLNRPGWARSLSDAEKAFEEQGDRLRNAWKPEKAAS